MTRFLFSAAVVATSTIASSQVAADQAQVTLTYVRAESVTVACPDESTFRGLVSARLGYDPFTPEASTALRVSLRPEGAYVVGHLSLKGANGDSLGARTMRAPADECLEVATSMALSVAVAIDPEAVGAVDAGPLVAIPLERGPATPVVVPPPRVEPSPAVDALHASVRHTAALRIDLGGVAAWGTVPALGRGARIGAAFDATAWSIGIEGTLLLPGAEDSVYGRVSAYAVYGALVPCMHLAHGAHMRTDLCVAGSAGALRSDASGVERAVPTTDVLMAIGPRAGTTVMPWPNLGFAAALDVPVSLSRVTLAIEEDGVRRAVWTSSLVGWAVRLSAVLRFG